MAMERLLSPCDSVLKVLEAAVECEDVGTKVKIVLAFLLLDAWKMSTGEELGVELTCVVRVCPSILPNGPGNLSKLDRVSELNNTSHYDSIFTG